MTTLAILLMGLATYLCRAGGYWLFRQIRPSPLLRSALAYVPGTLFVSFVVPSLIQGGLQSLAGGADTLGVMIATRNLLAAIVAGVAASWAVWGLR